MKALIKRLIGPWATLHINRVRYRLGYYAETFRRMSGSTCHECPICQYSGKFRSFGYPPRFNAECPCCGSLERHRLLYLAIRERRILLESADVLHFAPEPCLGKIIQQSSSNYRTADYAPGRASMVLNIEKIDLPDNSVDVVIANHVLEHVDDKSALNELYRILRAHGQLVLSVPIIEGWAKTYENPSIVDKADRVLHFGQSDHLRYYGRDFRDRIISAGFSVFEFVCDGPDAVRYALTRGETIFICTNA